MGRSRYRFVNPDQPHFMTLTVLHWMPVFFSFHAPAWKRKRHQVTRRYLLPRATWARRGCYIFLCSERDYTCGCVSGSVPTQERRYE